MTLTDTMVPLTLAACRSDVWACHPDQVYADRDGVVG